MLTILIPETQQYGLVYVMHEFKTHTVRVHIVIYYVPAVTKLASILSFISAHTFCERNAENWITAFL